MPSSKFARGNLPIKPPPICKAPPKPPLGPIPWPPPIILCAGKITYNGPIGTPYQVGGLIRCVPSGGPGQYYGVLFRPTTALYAWLWITTAPATVRVRLVSAAGGAPGCSADTGPDPIDPAAPLNHACGPWTYDRDDVEATAQIAT